MTVSKGTEGGMEVACLGSCGGGGVRMGKGTDKLSYNEICS